MNYACHVALILSIAPALMGQGVRDRNLPHKRLRMDVSTAPAPESLPSNSTDRSQTLALEKAERAVVRAPGLSARKPPLEKGVMEKARPARARDAEDQFKPASPPVKLSKGAVNSQAHGRHKGWVIANGR